MQTSSASTRVQPRPAAADGAQDSTRPADRRVAKPDAPRITSSTAALARPSLATGGTNRVNPAIQQNQVVEVSRSNEDPDVTMSRLSDARPTLKQSAAEYANEYLNQGRRKNWIAPRVKEKLDANELVLVDFTQAEPLKPTRAATRFTPIQYDPTSLRTTPLTDLFMNDQYASRTFDPDARHYGVYRKSDLDKSSFVTEGQTRYTNHVTKRGKQVDPDVATTALSLERLDAALKGIADDPRAGAPNDLPNYHRQRLESFFNSNLERYAQARHDQAIDDIERTVERRAGIADGSLQAQAGEPRFNQADEDMFRSALDGSVNGAAKVYPLRIGQHDSINAQRVTDHSGRTVLHMPGEAHPLRAFDDIQQAHDWMAGEFRQAGHYRTHEFARRHFSRNDATNRTGVAEKGVADQLLTMSPGMLDGMDTAAALVGPPFQAQARVLQQKTIADDKFDMSVAATMFDTEEVARATFLPLAGDIAQRAAAPVPAQARPGASETTRATAAASPAKPGSTALPTSSGRTSNRTVTQQLTALAPSSVVPGPTPSSPTSQGFPRNGTASEQLSYLESRYPSVQASAATYARQYMKDMYDLDVNPDMTVLAEFTGRKTGQYAKRELSEAKVTTLSQLFADNFTDGASDLDFSPRMGLYGLYPVTGETQTVMTAAAADPRLVGTKLEATPSLMDVRDLYRDMTGLGTRKSNRNHPNRFAEELSKQRQDFFSAHADDIAVASRTSALEQANAAHGSTLDDADYALVRDAFDNKPGKNITVSPLQVEGVEATGALLIANNRGRTVGYFPGADTPFVTGDSVRDVSRWMKQKWQDKTWKDDFIRQQFSLGNGNRFPNIEDAINLGHGAPFGYSNDRPGAVAGAAPIKGDPFRNRAAALIRDAQQDMKLDVKSNADLGWNQKLMTLGRVLPFPDTLAAVFGRGKMQAEAKNNVAIELAMAPLEFLPGGKAAKRGGQGIGKLATQTGVTALNGRPFMSGSSPVFRLPQKINGQIGYPLSPNGSPRLPGPSRGTVLAAPGGHGQSGVRADGASNGLANDGFVHTAGDTVTRPATPPRTKDSTPSHAPEQIELQDMTNGATRDNATASRRASTADSTAGTTASQSRSPTPETARPDLDPDPTAQELAKAMQIIQSHGMTKIAAPAWLKKPDWLTDEYVQRNGLVLPKGASTVDEMIASQQKKYADVVNRHTKRLSEAYEKELAPSEIQRLVEMQKAMVAEEKSVILSQWAQVNPSKPLTRVNLNGISALKSRLPVFKKQAEDAVASLKLSQAEKQAELTTLLSQNMRNNSVVLTRMQELQKQLDNEVKLAADALKTSLQKTQIGAAITVATVGGVAGLTAWIVKMVNDKK
ncbi:dermonecrotic toxin domain-containing protein [Herbaspirillum sp. YR522]|uniref:dermonecrotic toxin domain-containing protein n=1 Tax=Herbaspirillum sp. YR522 TaxID=1144342 RepID=UPI00026FA313|nr:DUF6543 domain-containing protein [Herbaspirillum sp. YR522]EJM96094.1 hypothetical protein PMI40_04763 [Herbaspirillum sp. YR522]